MVVEAAVREGLGRLRRSGGVASAAGEVKTATKGVVEAARAK